MFRMRFALEFSAANFLLMDPPPQGTCEGMNLYAIASAARRFLRERKTFAGPDQVRCAHFKSKLLEKAADAIMLPILFLYSSYTLAF